MNHKDNAAVQEADDEFSTDTGIATLPRFAPPEPAKAPTALEVIAPAEVGESTVSAPAEVMAEAAPSDQPAVVEAAAEVVAEGVVPVADIVAAESGAAGADAGKPSEAVSSDPEKKPEDEPVADAADAKAGAEADAASSGLAALRSVVGQVLSERGPDASVGNLSEDELARVAQRLNIHSGIRPDQLAAGVPGAGVATVPMSSGQRTQMQGANALAEGAASALGGAMALGGALGRGVGALAHGLANIGGKAGDKSADSIAIPSDDASLPAVLPRLSEYRILQAEKAAQHFAQEQDTFWNSSTKLTALRDEMQRIAREQGLPMQDVVEKMKPGGELQALRTKFNEAVSENPDTATRRKAMDKALDSYIRQYGRAQEEVLSPEQHGSPHYAGLKERMQRTHQSMEEKTAALPAFENEKGQLEQSHFEKLKAAVEAIMEKIKEVAQEFMAMLRGGKKGDDHAPAP